MPKTKTIAWSKKMMEYPNISKKGNNDSLPQKLAEILPDLKIEKMELADSNSTVGGWYKD